jgi:hypothetical protein
MTAGPRPERRCNLTVPTFGCDPMYGRLPGDPLTVTPPLAATPPAADVARGTSPDPRDNGARHLAGWVVAWVLPHPNAPHGTADLAVCVAPLTEEHMLVRGPFKVQADAAAAMIAVARSWGQP